MVLKNLYFLPSQVEEVTLTLEPEPCSLTPSPLREDAPSTRGSSPGLPAQTTEPVAERIPFDVTPCVVQSLEENDEEADEGSIVVVATNWVIWTKHCQKLEINTSIISQAIIPTPPSPKYLPTLRPRKCDFFFSMGMWDVMYTMAKETPLPPV